MRSPGSGEDWGTGGGHSQRASGAHRGKDVLDMEGKHTRIFKVHHPPADHHIDCSYVFRSREPGIGLPEIKKARLTHLPAKSSSLSRPNPRTSGQKQPSDPTCTFSLGSTHLPSNVAGLGVRANRRSSQAHHLQTARGETSCVHRTRRDVRTWPCAPGTCYLFGEAGQEPLRCISWGPPFLHPPSTGDGVQHSLQAARPEQHS